MSQVEPSQNQVVSYPLDPDAVQAQLLKDASIQFAHEQLPPPTPPPDWLADLGEMIVSFLIWLEPVMMVVFWGGIALLLGLFLYFILTNVTVRGLPAASGQSAGEPANNTAWQPSAQQARDLLAAADALAAEGGYGEAVHLILLRSIEDIERFRPRTIQPAFTARDITMLSGLTDQARPIFAQIAAVVEQALFAEKPIREQDFVVCREAYARFALPDSWRT